MKKTEKKGGTFEYSLKRLEEIVEKLETGSVSLDNAMELYEEGINISKKCLELLTHAELKLKRLTRDMNGNPELTDGI